MDAKEQHSGTKKSQFSRTRPTSGSQALKNPKALKVYKHDLPFAVAKRLIFQSTLSFDTETTGLDPHKDKLLLVQISTAGRRVYMIRFPDWKSKNLIRLLVHDFSRKIFHHAGFDLRFIKKDMGTELGGQVDCTRTLMKILHPTKACGLGAAIRMHYGIQIDKDVDHGKWDAEELSERQTEYAANDVIYLDHMANVMRAQLSMIPDGPRIYNQAMDIIQREAELDIEGFSDLLRYKKDKGTEVILKRENWLKSHEKHIESVD